MRMGQGVLMCWFVVTACANEDVVLFDFRGGGAAGASGMQSMTGMGATAAGGDTASVDPMTAGDTPNAGAGDATNAVQPQSCQTNTDCPAGSCEKLNCSDPKGSCINQPVCFNQTPKPVCGCDGVTYWNDCSRQKAGQSSSTVDACSGTAIRCRMDADCGGTDLVCGHLLGSVSACSEGMFGQHGPGPGDPQGNPVPLGTCWSIPDSCDAGTDESRWTECGAGTPMTCLDTCSALRTGRFFVPSPSGTCP
jgi:hypothetical protein